MSDDVSDCDYAEPHAELPLGHRQSPGQDEINQANNVPPVISHYSLSSPSSLDLLKAKVSTDQNPLIK